MYTFQIGNYKLSVDALKAGAFRIKLSAGISDAESMLTRYHILKTDFPEYPTEVKDGDVATIKAGDFTVSVDKKNFALNFLGGKHNVDISLSGAQGAEYKDNGFRIITSLGKEERLFGLGDESRDVIMKRGRIAEIRTANVTSYAPFPYVMSTNGWALLNNCTYAHTFDLGKTDPNHIIIDAAKGLIDFYVFLSDSMVNVLDLYTDISGKPLVLPKYAYGFTFVNNEEEGARDLLENCLHFRREDIPCDTMGLEPGWMSKLYDYSVNKKWDPKRFYIPYWEPENYGGSWSFFYNLRQMGFRLSLWLCCDYDLFWEEDNTSMELKGGRFDGAEIVDEHFSGTIVMDKITKQGEPWFEHLKKFVDQGASAFKLDGANQVLDHPDRLWAGKYTDDEVHNIYPVIYAKQMKEGFSNHTGKRALIYTPGLYAGSQQYCASWAGDTGGGPKTLISVLNLALCGHTNASCDMQITNLPGIHYGFFMPWSQLLGWQNWNHPWFLGDELEGAIRFYSKLRSSLFPYIYSMAHKASKTGLAISRPLSLMYSDKPEYDEILDNYMFGDSMLVSAFTDRVALPEGKWIDFWTGETLEGNKIISYTPPTGKGGGLFIKAGSVFAMQEPLPYLDKCMPDHYDIRLYAGAAAEFTLIEDDGISYEYLEGGKAETKMYLSEVKDGKTTFTLKKRTGDFKGRQPIWPYDKSATYDTDDSPKCPPVGSFTVKFFADKAPASVTLNGKAVDFIYDAEAKLASFEISAQLHCENDLEYVITL